MESLWLGTARADISPRSPLPVAGFGFRRGVSRGVIRPLQARIVCFSPGADAPPARRVLLISADILGWGDDQLERLGARLARDCGLPAEALILHATHSHSGPQLCQHVLPCLGVRDDQYAAWMEDQVIEAARRALASLEPARMELHLGECAIGVHRRRLRDGCWRMAPNPDGPVDHEVRVIRCIAPDDSTRALLVHFACHPTASADDFFSPEYPGLAMTALENEPRGPAMALFLQGCCGDIRPAMIRDGEFYRGDFNDAERLAARLADAVRQALARPGQPLPLDELETERTERALPLGPLPTPEQLRDLADQQTVEGEWSRHLLAHPAAIRPHAPLRLTLLRLSPALRLIFANAELMIEHGLEFKRRSDGRDLLVGCSNGILGYLPTARQLEEGGYEPAESWLYYGAPAPFTSDAEQVFRSAVERLVTAGEGEHVA